VSSAIVQVRERAILSIGMIADEDGEVVQVSPHK
jgi:hypothetical protein